MILVATRRWLWLNRLSQFARRPCSCGKIQVMQSDRLCGLGCGALRAAKSDICRGCHAKLKDAGLRRCNACKKIILIEEYGRATCCRECNASRRHAELRVGCALDCGRKGTAATGICRRCPDDLRARGLRWCSRCRTVRSLDDFPGKKRKNHCRGCTSDYKISLRYNSGSAIRCANGCARARYLTSDTCLDCWERLRRDGMQRCSNCKEVKPLGEFYANSARLDGRESACASCAMGRVRQKKYGLSGSEYAARVEAQGGLCAIAGCLRTATDIDHDHRCCPGEISCGKCVRSILCGPCNRLLGCVFEDLAHIEGLRTYVEHWRGVAS